MSKPRRKVIVNSTWRTWAKESKTAEQVVEVLIEGKNENKK